MGPIALLVNPQSRQNRRNPNGIRRMEGVLGDAGQMHRPSKAELPALAASLATEPPEIIAIHGGDGTVHNTLSQLIPAFASRGAPVPPIALLTGGTMNVISRSLGLTADSDRFLGRMVQMVTGREPLQTVPRRCLAIGDHFGFVFANGAFAGFLEQYYASGSYGIGRAIWIALRVVGSSIVGGAFAARALPPYRGRVIVDEVALSREQYTSVSAATVSQVGMGFRLHPRSDEDRDRFSIVAVTATTAALVADLWSVRRGRGISPERAETVTGAKMLLTPTGTMSYTIDGDLYQTSQPLTISAGPMLRLLKP